MTDSRPQILELSGRLNYNHDPMRNLSVPKLSRGSFFLGDALLLALALFILIYNRGVPGGWSLLACVFCVALGSVLAVMPFLLEYRAAIRLAETEGLSSAVEQIRHVEQIAAQIGYATSQWQIVREAADKTAASAKAIAENIAAEVNDFGEFAKRANDAEKSSLRLEVEKLRRAENDWLQVLVRMLDHVYAIHSAAVRSGQPGVIRQLDNFQNACRDAARRVGLVPFIAASDEVFDAKRHQLMDGAPPPAEPASVEETVATGYTLQGKLLRPALVRLRSGAGTSAEQAHSGQDQDDAVAGAGQSPEEKVAAENS